MSLPELLSMFGLRAQTFSPALMDKHIDGHGHDSVLTPLGVLLSVKLPPYPSKTPLRHTSTPTDPYQGEGERVGAVGM